MHQTTHVLAHELTRDYHDRSAGLTKTHTHTVNEIHLSVKNFASPSVTFTRSCAIDARLEVMLVKMRAPSTKVDLLSQNTTERERANEPQENRNT